MLKKKTDIGIVTWHYHTNVGSNLQAYALFKVISDKGYSCKFINYKGNVKKFSVIGVLKNLVKNIVCKVYFIFPGLIPSEVHKRVFIFQKCFMKETVKRYYKSNLSKCNKKFSLFICGSDQIWAPNVLDDVYLLSFVDEEIPKCSYAASIGLNDIPNEKRGIYKKYLEFFDIVSVREKQGKQILDKFINKEVTTVLDPTFLLTKEQWESIMILPNEDNFLFCYFLGNNEKYCDLINKIAEANNLKVICMSNTLKQKYPNWKYHSYIDPREFIGYIKRSKVVITDSFHGMAMSINMQKDFYVLERFKKDSEINQNSRIYNILEMFSLYDRLIDEPLENLKPIDYLKLQPRISKARENSLQILTKMLKLSKEKK